MKNSFKMISKIGILLFFLSNLSCSSSGDSSKNSSEIDTSFLPKKWILTDDLTDESPTMIIMSIEENGYFQIYDTILDTKFVEAGIKMIQPISKGQWKTDGDNLILTHFTPEDENPTIYKIKSLASNKMVTIGSNNKTHIYKSK